MKAVRTVTRVLADRDELLRPGTTVEALAGLTEGAEVSGTVTLLGDEGAQSLERLSAAARAAG